MDGMSTNYVEIQMTYEGDLRSRAVHGPSKTELLMDAPVDNHGKGESFSPTDLVATALGGCMATVMGISIAGSTSIRIVNSGPTTWSRSDLLGGPGAPARQAGFAGAAALSFQLC